MLIKNDCIWTLVNFIFLVHKRISSDYYRNNLSLSPLWNVKIMMTFSVFKLNYFTLLNRSVITLVNHRKILSDMSAKSESGRRSKITVFLPSDNIRPKSQSIGYIIRGTFKNYCKPCNMVQNYNGFVLLAKTMPEMTPADHWLLESRNN